MLHLVASVWFIGKALGLELFPMRGQFIGRERLQVTCSEAVGVKGEGGGRGKSSCSLLHYQPPLASGWWNFLLPPPPRLNYRDLTDPDNSSEITSPDLRPGLSAAKWPELVWGSGPGALQPLCWLENGVGKKNREQVRTENYSRNM